MLFLLQTDIRKHVIVYLEVTFGSSNNLFFVQYILYSVSAPTLLIYDIRHFLEWFLQLITNSYSYYLVTSTFCLDQFEPWFKI